jgi:hypothetical protein
VKLEGIAAVVTGGGRELGEPDFSFMLKKDGGKK